MPTWSDSNWIKSKLTRYWESGSILRCARIDEGFFPHRLTLKKPSISDITENFATVSTWIKLLRNGSKSSIGYGYELIEKEMNNRLSGRNRMPTNAVIPTVQDALRLLKKEKEFYLYSDLCNQIVSKWPVLNKWVVMYPHKVLNLNRDWEGILAVLDWFNSNHNSGLYLRQLDISGIDTKFIEQRKGLLKDLLDIVLPEDVVDVECKEFEQRYGLKEKPVLIRFRILDSRRFVYGLSDITVPLKQLAAFSPEVTKVFITENYINGLCFPAVKDSLVIFGLGYGVDSLKYVPWLQDKEVYYWGDIDTHGFAILDKVRSFLPKTKSILMDEGILLSHRNLWCTEDKPFGGQLTRLTKDENHLLGLLQGNTLGKGIRLEQERIRFNEVQKVIDMFEDLKAF